MEKILNTLNNGLLAAKKHKACNEEYSTLNTDEDRLKFTLRLLQEYKISPSDIQNNEGKSASRSTEFKDKANKLYSMPGPGMRLQLDEIIEIYTKSVVYAPPGSRELSLAYANRSAALFKARLYDNCLQDIERALKLDYPDRLKAKLFARRARCLMILNPSAGSELEKALEEARQWLEKMDLKDAGRKVVQRTLNNPKQMASIEKPRIILDDHRNMPERPNDNPEIPGALSAIELKYSEKFGRHVVATRDIEPGEILALQQSYASILVPEKFYTHCANCLRQTWSSIPCDHCVEVIYCSERCRQAAWTDHHDVECQVVGPLIALEMSILGSMALRLAVRALKEAGSLQALKDELEAIDSSTDLRTLGFTGNVLDDTKYASVYPLARNTVKRSVPDLFGRSLSSSYILYMLATRSNMFGEKLEDDLDALEKNEWMTFIGGLIMRHQQIIPSNIHSVTEEGQGVEPIERGAAIMPFFSLFNHSCSPMISRCSYGRNTALLSEIPIKKGEQIFDSYGMHYALQPTIYRQRKLKQQYHFDCQCIACKNDWPLYVQIPSFRVQRLSKQVENMINAMLRNFDQYYELAAIGNVEHKLEMITELTNMIKVLYKSVRLPCHELNDVVETLKRFHALRGSRWQSLND